MQCPSCNSRLVGKIGNQHYYCWNCCVEFAQRGGRWEVFQVDQDGMLVPDDGVGFGGCQEAMA